MNSYLVFNHHSLPCDTSDIADEFIPDFLKICITAKKNGLSTILLDETLDGNWFRLKLSPNYFWQDWYRRNQRGHNKDRIRTFLNIATQQPLFRDTDIRDGVELFDVRFNGDSSFTALRAATWNKAPLMSFPTRSPWMTSPLQVEVDTLSSSEEIETHSYDILNFYSIESFKNEISSLRERRNSLIQSGKKLYELREELFPNITFCGKVEQQLNVWSASTTILEQFKESLAHLNTFAEQWKKGEHDHYSAESLRKSGLNHRVSGESERVLSIPRLRSQREFWLPEGSKELFENHIKLTQGYRLHFFPDNHLRHIYVAYMGPHLKLR